VTAIGQNNKKLVHASDFLPILIPLDPRFPSNFNNPYPFKGDQKGITSLSGKDAKGTIL